MTVGAVGVTTAQAGGRAAGIELPGWSQSLCEQLVSAERDHTGPPGSPTARVRFRGPTGSAPPLGSTDCMFSVVGVALAFPTVGPA